MTGTLRVQWTLLTSSARLQRSSQCLSIVNNKVLIFGGEVVPRQPVDNQIDMLDLSNGAHIKATTLPVPANANAPSPRVGATTTAIKDHVYLFSGRGGLGMEPVEEKGAIWRYSSSASSWDVITPSDPSAAYPEGRSYHAMTSDGQSTLFIHAGCPEKGRLPDVWTFNLDHNKWSRLPDAPSAARGGTSIAYHSGILYRMHGFDGQKEIGGEIDTLDVQSGKWTTTTSFTADGINAPEPRSVSALCILDGYIVTLFGETDPSALGHAGAGKMLGNVWAYSLQAKKWTKMDWEGEGPKPRGWFAADLVPGGGKDGKSAVVVHGGLAEDNSRLGDIWKLELL
ncbi:hypothetical protein D9757_007978 [Collybiopsis confluens]|uniref:Galactose oxidase n=1 Tax=Collybiopsis confluens TaxID=2823264 RepID=A0A8H5M481_9AGAR|nr:hypothetical protein D9757_007978 [Collybiopsis confluens]